MPLGTFFHNAKGQNTGRVLSFFSSRRNWDSPNPSPAAAGKCAPPRLVPGGGAHSLAREGVGESRVRSHAPFIRSHRGIKVVWPDFQPMRVPEEPVCVHLFRQKPVFTSLHLKSPVHVHRLRFRREDSRVLRPISLWGVGEVWWFCTELSLLIIFYVNKRKLRAERKTLCYDRVNII